MCAVKEFSVLFILMKQHGKLAIEEGSTEKRDG